MTTLVLTVVPRVLMLIKITTAMKVISRVYSRELAPDTSRRNFFTCAIWFPIPGPVKAGPSAFKLLTRE